MAPITMLCAGLFDPNLPHRAARLAACGSASDTWRLALPRGLAARKARETEFGRRRSPALSKIKPQSNFYHRAFCPNPSSPWRLV